MAQDRRAEGREPPGDSRLSMFECEMLLRWFLAHLDLDARRALMRELPTYYSKLIGRGALGLTPEDVEAAAPHMDEITVAYRLATSDYGSAGTCRVAMRLIQSLGIPCVMRGNQRDGWRIVLGVPDQRARDVEPSTDEEAPAPAS